MRLFDALQLTSAPVIDDAGNMLVSARSARTGVQIYRGAELGDAKNRDWVRLYRPADEVFSTDSLASYTAIPVTIEHPKTFVTADTWKDVAVGETDGAIKDGDFIRVPFTIRHAKAIKSIRDGKSEISMGYSVDLDWTSGVTDAGEEYDVIARNLKMNHLAVVDAARGGPALRIGDEGKKAMKTIVIDAVPYNQENLDGLEAAVRKVETARDTANAALSDAENKLAQATTAHVTAVEAKDAQVATLTAQVATLTQQLADAAITPAKLRDAAAAYAVVVNKAKALGVEVADNASESDIKRAVVTAKLGDAAKDWNDSQFDTSFATLTVGVKDAAPVLDSFQREVAKPVTNFNDGDVRTQARTAHQEMIDAMRNGNKVEAK